MAYQPIESYGIVGDLNTVALISRNASIDFLCFPRFDSPSVFAALLDDEKGGRFQIAPKLSRTRRRQLYLPDTNVLITRFLSPDGVAEITDFMPVEEVGFVHDLMRQVRTVRGEVHFELVCQPRFDYARASHRVERTGSKEVVFSSEGSDKTVLRLRGSVPLELAGGDVRTSFTLRAGEVAEFVLEEVRPGSGAPSIEAGHVQASMDATVRFWRRWAARSRYSGRWWEVVNRSALTLKLLFSRPFGSIVAAPTFGLPETVGGERNWDYRYVWIRDSAFTLHSLLLLGHMEEAEGFMRWIEARAHEGAEDGPNGPLQVMYGIDGRRHLDEEVLPHLEGYRGSSPVRVGNAAYNQLQLDIYGELMDAIYVFDRHGAPIAYDHWRELTRLTEWVASSWRQPDEGIWEVRGGRKRFLYSRTMCWVALDRAIRLARERGFPAPVDHWMTERDAIYNEVYDNFWLQDRQAFAMYQGTDAMDASSLLMPMVKMISFREPRWLTHLRAIDEDLVSDSLVYRYRPDQEPDGLRGNEGTFSMCSFWYVENLARAGMVDKARFYFEKMLGYANHVGLYSEELGRTGEHLGNFPQAFTHMGLISAAIALDEALAGDYGPVDGPVVS